MKRPILINAIVVISALQFIGCAPVFAQDDAYPRHRLHAGVFGNSFAGRSQYVGYENRAPRPPEKRYRPDDRERDHRKHHHHRRRHGKRRAERVKVVEVVKVTGPRGDQPERVKRVERVERVEVRRIDNPR